MGFLDALKMTAEKARWDFERARRKRANLNLKMEIFAAEYKNPILENGYLPLFERSIYRPPHPDDSYFISCYSRVEYKSGVTKFFWHYNIDRAIPLVAQQRLERDVVRVVGPCLLPMGEDDRYV
jgi:hypothetical protein